jgi:hypothetical protein
VSEHWRKPSRIYQSNEDFVVLEVHQPCAELSWTAYAGRHRELVWSGCLSDAAAQQVSGYMTTRQSVPLKCLTVIDL